MSVGVLDHFNIRTRKLDDTVRFYEDVLGLEKGARPNFAFPGAWMYSEGKPVVHLVDISRTDEPQKPDSGVVHHVAFVSRGFAGMKRRQVPGGDLWQIFVNDPNGVMIELNYEAAIEGREAAPTERADDVGAR
jgi:catechol 2,3-dioxygenase-like lactoylglutathione lyase family enzyme